MFSIVPSGREFLFSPPRRFNAGLLSNVPPGQSFQYACPTLLIAPAGDDGRWKAQTATIRRRKRSVGEGAKSYGCHGWRAAQRGRALQLSTLMAQTLLRPARIASKNCSRPVQARVPALSGAADTAARKPLKRLIFAHSAFKHPAEAGCLEIGGSQRGSVCIFLGFLFNFQLRISGSFS